VDAVALQAVGDGAVALIHRRTDAGALEALGKREAADAAADDEDVERVCRRSLGC
jgi:hypothetical protein